MNTADPELLGLEFPGLGLVRPNTGSGPSTPQEGRIA